MSRPPYIRQLPVVILVGLITLVAQYATFSVVMPIGVAVPRTGTSWSEFLRNDLVAWFSEAVPELSKVLAPARLLRITGLGSLIPAGAALLVYVYWRRVVTPPRSRRESFLFQALALAPALAGALWGIRHFRRTLAALADAGLTSPRFVGIGLAESSAGVVLGCALGLFLLLVFQVLVRINGFAPSTSEA